jgi:hypothetical protein
MQRLMRLAAVTAGIAFSLTVGVGTAFAMGADGPVSCSGDACSVTATNPGSPSHTAQAQTAASHRHLGASGSGGGTTPMPYCTGSASFCQGVSAGYVTPQRKGGTIYGPASGKGKPAKPGLPAPTTLAAEAEKNLKLPAPSIQANPPTGDEQVVNVPTWLWIDRGGWKSITATASVPGESVTATARPLRIVWSMGDGSSVTCSGPGTAWSSGDDSSSSSPDCGHTFTVSSAGQPHGAYAVSATIEWQVVWHGGGAQGVFPNLRSEAAVAMRVSEVQALVTSG